MAGFNAISLRLKEMYQMITLGGDAELELVDTLDPFSEVRPLDDQRIAYVRHAKRAHVTGYLCLNEMRRQAVFATSFFC